MTRLVACVVAAFIVTGVAVTGRQQTPSPAARTAAAPDASFVKQYCLGCHNSRTNAGGLALDALNALNVDGHTEVWEKVVRKLRTGAMPPDGAPKPAPAARQTFTTALEAALDASAARRLDPGAPALHRLNRAEYSNAIRDLLALDVDVSALLPPDDSTAGFDNIADVLGVSPALIEGYVAAATKISRLAVGDPSIGFDRVIYRVPGDLSQDSQLEGLPIGTRGGIVVRHTFPLDAEYDLQVGQAGGGARLGGAPPAGGGRGDGAYVALDGVQIAMQGPWRNARSRVGGASHPGGCGARRESDGRGRRYLRHPGTRARHCAGCDRRSAQCNRAGRHTKQTTAVRMQASVSIGGGAVCASYSLDAAHPGISTTDCRLGAGADDTARVLSRRAPC
jgi:hypothetical protein